ncbi:MAG: hypothetical protein RR666_03430 [Raoultibacter sp.]
MTNLSDGLKEIFLAGVGAVALTGEKSKELVDQLIAKGELSVDQGREINQELQHKAETTVKKIRYDVLEQTMEAMTPEQREEFSARVAELAAKPVDPAPAPEASTPAAKREDDKAAADTDTTSPA